MLTDFDFLQTYEIAINDCKRSNVSREMFVQALMMKQFATRDKKIIVYLGPRQSTMKVPIMVGDAYKRLITTA